MAQVPIAEGLFGGSPDAPQLVGSKCGECGIVTFPRQNSCPRCAFTEMVEHLLPRQGTLWAWTTQSFPPPAPPYAGPTGKDVVPFGVGFVDLGEVKVEARLTESDPAKLQTGMALELTLVPLGANAVGDEVLTFAFQPV